MPGYNAQAMVSPLATGSATTGMLVTAVELVDNSYDNGLLVPMMEQAEEVTGTKAAMTLADSGYFAGSDSERPLMSASYWSRRAPRFRRLSRFRLSGDRASAGLARQRPVR